MDNRQQFNPTTNKNERRSINNSNLQQDEQQKEDFQVVSPARPPTQPLLEEAHRSSITTDDFDTLDDFDWGLLASDQSRQGKQQYSHQALPQGPRQIQQKRQKQRQQQRQRRLPKAASNPKNEQVGTMNDNVNDNQNPNRNDNDDDDDESYTTIDALRDLSPANSADVEIEADTDELLSDTNESILSIRYHSITRQSSHLAQIHLFPGMTTEILGKCIIQATTMGKYEPIAGLFREHDGVFVSLEHLLATKAAIEHIYTIHSPDEKLNEQQGGYVIYVLIISFTVAICIALFICGPWLADLAWEQTQEAYKFVFERPLRDIYRFGPTFIGWGGASLPDICSRITYHGDKDFWARNHEECSLIYHAKEEAFLRMIWPILYTTMIVIGIWTIRSIILELAERQRRPDLVDQDTLEAYKALQVIFGQMARLIPNHDNRR